MHPNSDSLTMNPKKAPSRSDSGDLALSDSDSNASQSTVSNGNGAPASPSTISSCTDEDISPNSKAEKKRWADLLEEEKEAEDDECWVRSSRALQKEVSSRTTHSTLRPNAREFVMGDPAMEASPLPGPLQDALHALQKETCSQATNSILRPSATEFVMGHPLVATPAQLEVSEDAKQALHWVKMLDGYDCWPYNRFTDHENNQNTVVVLPPAILSQPDVPSPLQASAPLVAPLTPLSTAPPPPPPAFAVAPVLAPPPPPTAPPPPPPPPYASHAPPAVPRMLNAPSVVPGTTPASVQETFQHVGYPWCESNYTCPAPVASPAQIPVSAPGQAIIPQTGAITPQHTIATLAQNTAGQEMIAPCPVPSVWPMLPTELGMAQPGDWLPAEPLQRPLCLSACV